MSYAPDIFSNFPTYFVIPWNSVNMFLKLILPLKTVSPTSQIEFHEPYNPIPGVRAILSAISSLEDGPNLIFE